MHAPISRTHTAYFPAFDYLRGLLAVTVMLAHDRLLPWGGSFAVEVFFALSGWLIGGILMRTDPAGLPRFFFNRAIRIWVPYYFAFALLIAASLLRDPVTAKWMEITFYKATFVYNIFGTPQLAEWRASMPLSATGSHFWSVNAEEQFYLIAPILLVLLPSVGRRALVWVLICALTWYTHLYASIAFGVLAAVYFSDRKLPPVLLPASLAAVSAVGMSVNYLAFAPFAAISIVLAVAVPGRSSKIGQIVGGMSYPLYLNHWIGVFVMNAVLSPFGMRDTLTRQILACIFSVALAVALYLYMERPLLLRRDDLFTSPRGIALTCAAYATMAIGVIVGLILSTS